AAERRAQRLGARRPLMRDAETVGELHEIGVGQIAGDDAVAVILFLAALHIAEGVIVEDDEGHAPLVPHRRSELLYLEHEAAIASDADDRPVGARGLRAERRAEAPAERALIGHGQEGARCVSLPEKADDVADLRYLVDEDAVFGQLGAQRRDISRLR